MLKDYEDAQQKTVSTFSEIEHLQAMPSTVEIKYMKKQTATKTEAPEKQTSSQLIATLTVQPEYRSVSILRRFDDNETVDLVDFTVAVKELSSAIRANDMKRAEEMLAAQAVTLDGLFTHMAVRAGSTMEKGYGEAAERYMKLALRAQAQCTKAILAIGELRNPRQISFVQQANIAHNQQVNNGQTSRTQNSEIQPNKLIDGESYDVQMDGRTTQTAGRADQKMEAVGAINGACDARGQGKGIKKRL